MSRERVASSRAKPSPARAARGHPLPQAREGKACAGEFANIDVDPNSETLDDDYAAFCERKKTLPREQAQAIEARFQAAFARERDEQRRFVNNIFRFWIVCEDRACKRAGGCAGDPHACRTRWWPLTPERHKAYYRAYVSARAEGGDHGQACQHAGAEVKRLAEHIARVEAQQVEEIARRDAEERARIPSPFVGEGGACNAPGEGFASTKKGPLTPPASPATLSHKGRGKKEAAPRVRGL